MNKRDNRNYTFCPFCQATTPRDSDGACLACEEDPHISETFTQVWSCARCSETGAVEYLETATPKTVIGKVIADHKEKSPFCSLLDDITLHAPIDQKN